MKAYVAEQLQCHLRSHIRLNAKQFLRPKPKFFGNQHNNNELDPLPIMVKKGIHGRSPDTIIFRSDKRTCTNCG